MKNKFALSASAAALFALIFSSDKVIESSRYALTLCMNSVIPSLLPFFIVSILLNRLGLPYYLGKLLSPAAKKLFGISGAGASAFFIGICGGYPLGAAYIADMVKKGYIPLQEAERLLGFCNNSGPAFIIGVVGAGVFHSAGIGVFLYIVHISAAFLTGLILRQRNPEDSVSPDFVPMSFFKALPDAVQSSVSASLNVCGFIICFSVLVAMLDTGGYFSLAAALISDFFNTELHWSRALLTGVIELGSAAGAMSGLIPKPINLALAAAILAWGGLSVHFQTYAVISDTSLKGTLHLAGRLLNAAFSAVLAYFFSYLL